MIAACIDDAWGQTGQPQPTCILYDGGLFLNTLASFSGCIPCQSISKASSPALLDFHIPFIKLHSLFAEKVALAKVHLWALITHLNLSLKSSSREIVYPGLVLLIMKSEHTYKAYTHVSGPCIQRWPFWPQDKEMESLVPKRTTVLSNPFGTIDLIGPTLQKLFLESLNMSGQLIPSLFRWGPISDHKSSACWISKPIVLSLLNFKWLRILCKFRAGRKNGTAFFSGRDVVETMLFFGWNLSLPLYQISSLCWGRFWEWHCRWEGLYSRVRDATWEFFWSSSIPSGGSSFCSMFDTPESHFVGRKASWCSSARQCIWCSLENCLLMAIWFLELLQLRVSQWRKCNAECKGTKACDWGFIKIIVQLASRV